MSLMDSFREKIGFTPYVNTGTIFDLATGKYVRGLNGKFYLNGGLSLILGITGRGQTYKSSIAGSLMSNTLFRYDGLEASVFESEFTIPDATRYDDFVPEPVSDRIAFYNRASMNLGDWYEHIKKIGEEKLKSKKEYMVESPFLDPITCKPYRVWLPTICMVDSWSKAGSSKEDDMYGGKNKVDDSSMNTLYMQEGGVKTRIMRALPTLASKYGIYVVLTAHVGNKIDMDPYNKAPKQLQYMKGTDKIRNVGSEFEFLTTTLMQTAGVQNLLTADRKESLYPYGRSPLTEVNEINAVMVRCKNNASGATTPYVVSQYQGILNYVTYFHLLRKNKNFGLTETRGKEGTEYTPILTPDKSVTRKNIRETTNRDYEICRALEIIAQICFIQNYWSSFGMPEYVFTPIQKIAEKLQKSSSPAISDILNSEGHWSWGKRERPYMSTMDVLELVSKLG